MYSSSVVVPQQSLSPVPQSSPYESQLAHQATQSHYMGADNLRYSSTTSVTNNVVPTGLFTSYVPATELQGIAVHNNETGQAADLAAVHQNRMAANTTVYYTDDLNPPFWHNVRKTRQTTKKNKSCCCCH